MVTALMVKTGERPNVTHLCDNAEFLNMAVSIDTLIPCSAQALQLKKDIAIIRACEGTSLSLDGNRRVKGHIILGTFYVVAIKDGRLRSLTDNEITRYMSQFWEPELFTEDEIIESWFDKLALSL